MKYIILYLVAGVLLSGAACNPARPVVSSGSSDGEEQSVVFYNVENLFDTRDDPATMDDDFTPAGKLAWDEERLRTKIDHIGEVITRIDAHFPVLVGLCEVENSDVLNLLVQSSRLSEAHYKYVHKDSPDERGIDVALLYDPAVFALDRADWITVKLNNPEDPNTRDILYAKGRIGSDILHVFVNHWPSRGGGQKETEPYRVQLADALHSSVESILNADKDARIVIMGDFNDYPMDKSIASSLNAGSDRSSLLYDYMHKIELAGEGSHWYKGHWGALDQFIGSWPLVESQSGLTGPPEAAKVFREDFLLFTDQSGERRPNRTYAGDRYVGGYSDHLPIVLGLRVAGH